MKYYLVEEDANYCGFEDEYLIKSDKPFDDVDMFACEHADERSANEADPDDEQEEDDPLHISGMVSEISEEEFNKYKEEGYEVYEV